MKSTLFILSFCLLSACFGKKPSLNTGHEGKPIPSVNILLVDSITHLNTLNIPKDKPIVFLYFSPYCPYCKAITKNIIADAKNLANINIYMLSNFSITEIKKYYNQYSFEKYSNIIVAQDYQLFFSKYFKIPAVPYIAIYGKDKRLKQVFLGSVSTDLIKDVALE